MKFKKSFAVILTSVLAISMLSGCGDEKKVSSNIPTLRMLYPLPGGPQTDEQIVETEINKVLKEKLNCQVNIEMFDFATWNQKFPLMMQSGEQLDLAWVNAGTMMPMLAKNSFLDITELTNEYGKDLKNIVDPVLLEGAKINGKLFAIPVNKEVANNEALYFDKDIVDKYGFVPSEIDTYDKLEKVFAQVKAGQGKNYYPLYMNVNVWLPDMKIDENTDLMQYSNLDGSMGLKFDNVTKKVGSIYEIDYFIKKAKYIEKWNKLGYVNADATTTTQSQSDAIKLGNAMMITGTGKPGAEAEIEAILGGKKVVRGFETTPLIKVGSLLGSAMAIPYSAKYPEKAMELINLLYTDKELLNLWVNGIEGKHYTKVSENVISYPAESKKSKKTGYMPGINWVIGNQFNNYLWEFEDVDKWEKFKKFNQTAKKDTLMNFYINTETIKNEVATTTNVMSEYGKPYGVGMLDVDKVNVEIIQKLKSNGFDNVIAEVQRQIDEYLSASK